MDHPNALIVALGLIVVGAPILLLCFLGLTSLLKIRVSEVTTGRACQLAILPGLAAAVLILILMLVRGTRYEAIEVGDWVAIPEYDFTVKLVFDRLSLPFAILTFVLCGTIAAFTTRYLHCDRGYHRFFVLFALFVVGMVLTAVAGTIETLFAGWELVGLSSALLVAYFQERPAPVRNGLRIWIVYRISDAALLLAAIAMHHLTGVGDFSKLVGGGPWPDGRAAVSGWPIVAVGLLVIIAAAGKSALVPFSGWLPRAMEGPTPSSAIFYGALSVHLGAYLLLRVSPLLEASLLLSTVVVVLGLATALYAYVVGSVQTDIKSALAFASLVQVGLIVAEIGVGLHYIPLIHLLGNACLRTFQFLRAPTLLRDYHQLENAIGAHLPNSREPLALLPRAWRPWLYRFALERGYLDAVLQDYLVGPFVRFFRWCDEMEHRWTSYLAGGSVPVSSPGATPAVRMEDLP